MNKILLIVCCLSCGIFSTTFSICAIGGENHKFAVTLTLPTGEPVQSTKYPLVTETKLAEFIANGEIEGSFAMVRPENKCLSYWHTAWGGENPKGRALERCNARVHKFLTNYTTKTKNKCKCVIVIENQNLLREGLLKYRLKRTVIKIYLKKKNVELNTVRGFLEYEKSQLENQNVRIFNEDLKEVCRGHMNFSLKDAPFDLLCLRGSKRLSGTVTIKRGALIKAHAIGSAILNDGSVFAFITRLNDQEIIDKYPNFPVIE